MFRRLAGMPTASHVDRTLGGLVAGALLALVLAPLTASAHSELKSADPAEGATVATSFSGPLVLTFSEELADGSKADLVGPDGSVVASATVNATAATMTFTLSTPLPPGAYEVKWVSIAGDGDLLRGTVKFTVAAAATTEPSMSDLATPAATTPASPATTGAGSAGGGSDVVLPILIVLVVVAAGAVYLVRRSRTA